MKELNVELDKRGFVNERVLFIPNGEYEVLFESEWDDINSTIKDML